VNRALRAGIAVLVLGLLIWVGIGIYRAGGDVPTPSTASDTKLTSGHAEGRRMDGKPSWSLDYDRIVASADTTIATLYNVRHGTIYKRGKPFMNMVAKQVVVNTLSNDFVVTGPMTLTEIDGQHDRRLSSDAANYSGTLQTLNLSHPAKISSDGARVTVATATVKFRSGDMNLGPLVGHY
jgi:hypothetical protein